MVQVSTAHQTHKAHRIAAKWLAIATASGLLVGCSTGGSGPGGVRFSQNLQGAHASLTDAAPEHHAQACYDIGSGLVDECNAFPRFEGP